MISDLLFPKRCLECNKKGVYICPSCLKKVRPGTKSNLNYSLFGYEGVIRSAIIKLKYKYATEITEELADVCVKRLKKTNTKKIKSIILVPIPLYWKRKNERGFNQVEEIGKIIAKKMNWRFMPDLLIRAKSTTPQVQLRGEERRKNLSNVFQVNSKYTKYKNHHVLLFDDVYTTGSTVNEAKKTFQKTGFGQLENLTIAR